MKTRFTTEAQRNLGQMRNEVIGQLSSRESDNIYPITQLLNEMNCSVALWRVLKVQAKRKNPEVMLEPILLSQ